MKDTKKNEQQRSRSRMQGIAVSGLMLALMVLGAWVTIPLGAVPVTLQVFVMVLALLILKPQQFFISLTVYLTMGALGLPVFSGMRGGIGVLVGPTGGFLWGFMLGALAAMALFWMCSRDKVKKLGEKKLGQQGFSLAVSIAMSAVFLITSYACGWFQITLVANMSPMAAFTVAVAPFLIIDIIKIAVAIPTAEALKRALSHTGILKSRLSQ